MASLSLKTLLTVLNLALKTEATGLRMLILLKMLQANL